MYAYCVLEKKRGDERHKPQTTRPRTAPPPKTAPTFPLKKPIGTPAPTPVQPSTVLQKLAQAHSQQTTPSGPEPVSRSTAFSAPPPTATLSHSDSSSATARDENLALVEELTLGPSDHKAPFDDPNFERLEPNSGIRLS